MFQEKELRIQEKNEKDTSPRTYSEISFGQIKLVEMTSSKVPKSTNQRT